MNLFNEPWHDFVEAHQTEARNCAHNLTEQDFEQKTIKEVTESISKKLIREMPKISKNTEEWKKEERDLGGGRAELYVHIPFSGHPSFFCLQVKSDFECRIDEYHLQTLEEHIHQINQTNLVLSLPIEEGIRDKINHVLQLLRSCLGIHERKYKKFFDSFKRTIEGEVLGQKSRIESKNKARREINF